ncbi:armadillo repeat-containing protein 1 [Patella vulgata]|uniref:armadillo repeat-containing protein 1 n=1 Tax=Patella vulgata TaxID=6465 RepID=UPI00217F99D8|nr:armadillo repeat-containing protein 1 [Patella vulgata]
MDANAIKMVQTMASDSRKRLLIIKDNTCMSGLVSLLSNTDEDIISVVLETLMMLGKSAEEIKWLGYTPGLIKSLKTIMKREKEKNSVRVKAEEFYNILCNGRKDTRTPLRDSNRKYNDKDDKNSLKSKNSPGYHAKAIVLLIKGITNKCDADLCIKLLIEVKGVISITFDMESKRCIVRTKSSVKPETLVKVISNSQTFIAQQVIKHENGNETLQSFGMEVLPSAEKENLSEPEYLPDDIDSPVASSKAVARGGYPKQEHSWLSAAASFLSNSFYW